MIAATLALATCMVIAAPKSPDQHHVHDGDGVVLKCPDRVNPIDVRIMEIDSPEIGAFTWKTQPWAIEARDALTALCLNKSATASLIRYDHRTARWIGRVKCDGTDVASYMVANGHAWAFMTSAKSKIPALQQTAQAAGKGLWGQPSPIPPSAWRKGQPQC